MRWGMEMCRSRVLLRVVLCLSATALTTTAVAGQEGAWDEETLACFRQQEVLAAAFSRYVDQRYTEIWEKTGYSMVLLVEEGFIGEYLRDPGGDAASWTNYVFRTPRRWGVACKVHGGLFDALRLGYRPPEPNTPRTPSPTVNTPERRPRAGPSSEHGLCLQVRFNIARAAERYHQDTRCPVPDLDVRFLHRLTQEAYLWEMPDDPGQGEDTWDNYFWIDRKRRLIGCRVHKDTPWTGALTVGSGAR